ncbi:Lysophosphatidylcholine acyltransferase [Taenia solium]|eukprot:TsM_000023500 transcript=TsM_000023500 gene=TsM_000023500
MEELDGANYGEPLLDDTSLENPFVHSIHISPAHRVQLWLFAVFVFPFRLLFMLTFLFLALFFGELTIRRMDFSKPMSGFRKHVLLPVFIFCGRMLFSSGGFIWVGHKGKRASCEEAPILVLAPHSSFYDSLVFLSLGMPSVVVDSITWTWDGPGILELLWLTALQHYITKNYNRSRRRQRCSFAYRTRP